MLSSTVVRACAKSVRLAAFPLLILAWRSAVSQSGQMHYYPSMTSGSPSKGPHTNGQAPIADAHVYVFAVGMGGANTGAVSLLNGPGVSTDSAGNGYVLSDSNGNFSISGLYANQCPSPDSQVYLVTAGGSAGGSGNNPYLREVAAMPVTCSNLPNVPSVGISEATTMAAAFALAGFADTVDDGLSTAPSAATALSTGFAFANSLASGYTGKPSGTDALQINTTADVLGACINSNGGPACTSLMSYATLAGTNVPQNTWEAALSMAIQPTNNIQNEYYLVSPTPPYTPTYSNTPSTWQLPAGGGPEIDSFDTDLGDGRNVMTIYGAGFGTTLSAITVLVGGSPVNPGDSDGSTMDLVIPSDPNGLAIQVFVSGYASNPLAGPPKILTTTTVTVNQASTAVGNTYIIQAVVSTNTSLYPTGAVICTNASTGQTTTGNLTLGSVNLTFTAMSPPGSQTINCAYQGSVLYATSSGSVSETVVPPLAPVNVTLTSSGQTVYGDLAQFTVSVVPQSQNSASPTGTFSLFEGSTRLVTENLSSPSVTFGYAGLSVGSHTLTATYSGDSTFQPGTSPPITQVVTGQAAGCTQ